MTGLGSTPTQIPAALNLRAAANRSSGSGASGWDLQARADGCSGPSGISTDAGAGFVDPRAPAGALILRTRDGHTEFSVNHRITSSVKDNEGFFEFDVELK